MAYNLNILALSPDHRWKFDGNSTDDVGALVSTDTSLLFTGAPLCEDTINSMYTDADGDICISTASTDTSYAINDVLYAGWFMTDKIQQPPCRIIGDGGTTQSMAIYLGFGNSLIFEIDYGATTTLQIYGSTPLEANRKYHIAVGYTSSNVLVAYIDGILQTDTANDTGSAMANNRGTIKFGGSTATTDFTIGGTGLKLVSVKSGYYNQWATFNVGIPSQAQIRSELFEKGALADVVITNQAGLDALASTLRPNAACCIRVTGNGVINLTANNVTFSPLASIHIQYTGTGTLNWTNGNGSNASISSVTAGGTVNIINPSVLTINGLINGCELYIYDNEIVNYGNNDTVLSSTLSNVGTSYTYNYDGSVNTIVIQMIANGYVEILQEFTLSGSDEILTLFPEIEENA